MDGRFDHAQRLTIARPEEVGERSDPAGDGAQLNRLWRTLRDRQRGVSSLV
jgi:hypothetical protein